MLESGIWAIIGILIGLFFGVLITYFILAVKRNELAEHPLPAIVPPTQEQKEDLNKFLEEQYQGLTYSNH